MSGTDTRYFADLKEAAAASREALKAFGAAMDRNFAEFQAQTQSMVDHLPSFKAVAPVTSSVLQDSDMLMKRRRMFQQALSEGDWGPFNAYAIGIGQQFAKRGMAFEEYPTLT